MKVKFMGWCSSKNNTYVKEFIDIDKYYNVLNTYTKNENNVVPTIADLFKEMIVDHIKSSSLHNNRNSSNIYNIDDYEGFSDEEFGNYCCAIS